MISGILTKGIFFKLLIGRPLMTSEWGHVQSISVKDKVVQKLSSRVQFWRLTRLIFTKRRRLMATVKLSSRFLDVLTILNTEENNINIYLFRKFTKKEYMSRNSCQWIGVQKFKSISWKQLSFTILNVKNATFYAVPVDLRILQFLGFLRFGRLKRCYWVTFRVLYENLSCKHVTHHLNPKRLFWISLSYWPRMILI